MFVETIDLPGYYDVNVVRKYDDPDDSPLKEIAYLARSDDPSIHIIFDKRPYTYSISRDVYVSKNGDVEFKVVRKNVFHDDFVMLTDVLDVLKFASKVWMAKPRKCAEYINSQAEKNKHALEHYFALDDICILEPILVRESVLSGVHSMTVYNIALQYARVNRFIDSAKIREYSWLDSPTHL